MVCMYVWCGLMSVHVCVFDVRSVCVCVHTRETVCGIQWCACAVD